MSIYDALPRLSGDVQQVWSGIIVSAPADTSETIDVIIPDISTDIRHEDCQWMSGEDWILPKVGDNCLVVFDNDNRPWVVSWAPETRQPVQNGKWLKGSNGEVVWSALPYEPVQNGKWLYGENGMPVWKTMDPQTPLPHAASHASPNGSDRLPAGSDFVVPQDLQVNRNAQVNGNVGSVTQTTSNYMLAAGGIHGQVGLFDRQNGTDYRVPITGRGNERIMIQGGSAVVNSSGVTDWIWFSPYMQDVYALVVCNGDQNATGGVMIGVYQKAWNESSRFHAFNCRTAYPGDYGGRWDWGGVLRIDWIAYGPPWI